MAQLFEGKFTNDPEATISKSAEFKRSESSFRGKIIGDQVENNRYHLYVSYACPWAHRTLIARSIKGLRPVITVSVADPIMGDKGWTFSDPQDPKELAALYLATDKAYTGRLTVPVLWDKKLKGIVNNESTDILRIFNTVFDGITGSSIDLYPMELRKEIDSINSRVYENVNNGVYKTGFARTQKVYETNFKKLFDTLDWLEDRLDTHHFLAGDYLSEADIRLFTTLLRFDPVYNGHFKCNLYRICDCPNLYNYLKCLYQIPQIKETCHIDHIKTHYYRSHKWINPSGIVPAGPLLDLDSPHDRGRAVFYRRSSGSFSPSLSSAGPRH
jgi:putative glutathione S-transferase